MAYTAERTWVAGELVAEDLLNIYIRDNQGILKVPLDSAGKIIAISSTYFASLSGSNLTGVMTLASANTFTSGLQSFNGGSTVRLVVPVGTSGW
jgi:hypothetical protein